MPKFPSQIVDEKTTSADNDMLLISDSENSDKTKKMKVWVLKNLYNWLFQLKDKLVTAFSSTPLDTNYPSEKLVKDSLDWKANLVWWNTFSWEQIVNGNIKINWSILEIVDNNKIYFSPDKWLTEDSWDWEILEIRQHFAQTKPWLKITDQNWTTRMLFDMRWNNIKIFDELWNELWSAR